MAGSINKVILLGRLGADPEVRVSQEGNKIARFSIATSETWKDKNTNEKKDRTEWHKIVIFSPGLSEIAEKIEFSKYTAAFRNKKLIYGEKKLQNKYFYVNFQMVSASKRKEFVRKYFFFVDNKVVVMTIVSFHKPRKSTYSSFERFIKKLSKPSS